MERIDLTIVKKDESANENSRALDSKYQLIGVRQLIAMRGYQCKKKTIFGNDYSEHITVNHLQYTL